MALTANPKSTLHVLALGIRSPTLFVHFPSYRVLVSNQPPLRGTKIGVELDVRTPQAVIEKDDLAPRRDDHCAVALAEIHEPGLENPFSFRKHRRRGEGRHDAHGGSPGFQGASAG